MSWESRNGMGRYYTRSERVGGRIVREYVGSGIVGEMAHKLDLISREVCASNFDAKNKLAMEQRDLEAEFDRFEANIKCLMHAHLILAGFHLHKRGEWRKRNE